MSNLSIKKIIVYFLIVLTIFLLDRASKLYILNIAETNDVVDIYINNYLNIILVWNSGIGFGLLSFDHSTIYNSITFFILLINFLILYLSIKTKGIQSYFYLLILGGSIGNLFDRIYYSAVPDFIDISYKGFHWFVFNAADIFISLGIICLIFVELLNYKEK
tara:strand:- start:54 stop:539 length:486 start_codon:yes stop_codon:yes gene_type:complete